MRKLNRFLCLLLCLLLVCAAALAAEEYTMPDKMSRQVASGSGVKGAMTLAVAGGSEWLDLLLPFTGSNLQLRYIVKDGQFQGQLYALDDQEQQRALTQAYGDETHLYLRSELLPGKVLYVPFGAELMDVLFSEEGSNPTMYSVVRKLLSIPAEIWESDWLPVLAPYESALEQWLTDYASEPSIAPSTSGSSNMTLRHVIPAEALKACMKDLMRQFLQDGKLMDLVNPLLTDAQKALYMNPALGYFYDAVIDSLPLEAELTMERTLSARGDMLSTVLVMPLPQNANGWTNLSCEITGRNTSLTLEGPEQSVSLVLETSTVLSDRTIWNGIFRYLPAEGTRYSVSFSIVKQFSAYTDDESRSHEDTDWTLTVRPNLSHLDAEDPARADYADFETITAVLSTKYYSRERQNDPTTLEATLSAQLPALSLEMALALRTTSPWVLSDLPTANADELLTLSPEIVSDLLTEFSRNAALTMTSLTSTPSADESADSNPEPTLVPPAQ